MKRIALCVWSIVVTGQLAAAELKLEQILSRENPAFLCEPARLTVGRDGSGLSCE